MLLGGLLVLSLIAWLSAPAWLPALAAGQLPEGWRLDSAELDPPGFTRTHIDRARIVTGVAGLELTLQVEDADLYYDGPRVDVQRLEIDVRRLPAGPTEAPPMAAGLPEDLALPRLLPPGALPSVHIGELDFSWNDDGAGAGPRQWRFADLELDPSAERVRLDAGLDPPNGFGAPLALWLELGGDRLDLVVRRDGAPTPLFGFSQSNDGQRGDSLATAELDVDLAWLDASLLTPLTGMFGFAAPDEAAGRIHATATLRGVEELRPERVTLRAEALRLDNEAATIGGSLALVAERDGDTITATMERLELALEGALPAADEMLGAALEPLGLAPLLEASERSLRFGLSDPATATIGARSPYPLQVRMDGLLDVRFGDTEGTLALAGLELSTPALDRPAEAGLDTAFELRGRLDRPLQFHSGALGAGATTSAVAIRGTLTRRPNGALRATGDIDTLDLGEFSFSHPATTLRLGTLSVGGRFEGSEDGLSWSGPVAGTDLVVAPADAIAATSLLTASGLAFDLEAGGADRVTVTGGGRLDGVMLPDLGISLDSVAVDIETLSLPAVDGRLGLLTTGLEAAVDGVRYAGLDLDLEGALTGGSRYDGAGELLLGFTGSLPFAFRADLDAASVTATLDRAPLPAAALGDAARALALPLPQALAFTGGQLVLDGEVTLGEGGLGGALDARGEALGLALGESRVEGLEFETRVALEEVINGSGPLSLRVAQLAAGLDLVELDTAVTFRGADVGLLELNAQLLGGQLSTPGLRLSGGELLDTLIRWEGFDLGRLLAFVDVSGLQGSGTLDAELPLVNEGDGPSVRDGWFKARGPGLLRYGTGVPATNIGLQALENFQYDSLEGTLAYGADGAYTVTVDLLGRNPDLYGGHPVRFRLNLGGVMPALFRSLFVTGDFEKAIIERLRAGESPLEETP